MALEIALSRDMTEQQKAFVTNITLGDDPEEAAIKAGYNSLSARQMSWALMQQPHILAAVQIGIAKRLARGAPLALNVLFELVENKAMHPKLRLDAAKELLNRSGHIAPKAAAPGAAGETPLNEMSMGQLRELADKLEGEIAGRAKTVSSAKAAPRVAQAIEDII